MGDGDKPVIHRHTAYKQWQDDQVLALEGDMAGNLLGVAEGEIKLEDDSIKVIAKPDNVDVSPTAALEVDRFLDVSKKNKYQDL